MANIFSLYGSIFIDNEKANKSIDETTNKGQKAGTNVSGAFSNIVGGAVKMGTAIVTAGTAAATGIAALATGVADTAGSIDDSSQRVGMSAEEFQKYAYAAKLSGMESANLEKAMIKQQKLFAEATNGNKAASEAYKQLGINIKDIGTSGEAFDIVIKKLADMKDETQRNSLANDIFGKSYAELGPLLNGGAEGIEALKKEAVDLGAVMTNEAVSKGAEFGDFIDKVKASLGGILNSLGTAVMPILQSFIQLLIDNMPTIQNLLMQFAPIFTTLIGQMLPPLMNLTQQILPIIFSLLMQLLPFISQVAGTLLPIITQLLTMLLPPIIQIVQLLLPILLQLLVPLLPLLAPIFNLLQPFINLLMIMLEPLIQLINMILPPLIQLVTTILTLILPPLQAGLQFLASIVSGVFLTAFNNIKPVFENIKGVFQGIIDFIKNVFTGNWSGAWNAVVNIFSNIFQGITNYVKYPINTMIDLLNGFLQSLKGIKIPDWVPLVGGKSFNINLIKKLRVGIDNVPYDDMPAILHKGEAVLTAEENQRRKDDKSSNNDIKSNGDRSVTLNIYTQTLDDNQMKKVVKIVNDELGFVL